MSKSLLARPRGVFALCVFTAAVAGFALPAAAQKTTTTTPRQGGTSGSIGSGTTSTNGYNPFGTDSRPENDPALEDSRRRAREAERQRRMVEDANRLVALAARYRASVSEHGNPTAEDARLLQEMEKLARSVKDRMRGM